MMMRLAGAVLGFALVAGSGFAQTTTDGLGYFTVTPCRVLDTRLIGAAGTPLAPGVVRSFRLRDTWLTYQGGDPNGCDIPPEALSVMANVIAIAPAGAGNIKVWAHPLPAPPIFSVINFGAVAGLNAIANAIAVPICNTTTDLEGCLAEIDVVTGPVASVHLAVDVVGYFAPTPLATAGLPGARGSNGPKGDTGANGTNGADGAKGDTGEKGDTGANGTNGTNGAKGDTGAKGEQGDPGWLAKMKCDTYYNQGIAFASAPSGYYYLWLTCPAGSTLTGGGFELQNWTGIGVTSSGPDVDGSKNKRWFTIFRWANPQDTLMSNTATCCKMVDPAATSSTLDELAHGGAFFEAAAQPSATPSFARPLPSANALEIDPTYGTHFVGPGVIAAPPSQ